MCGRYQFTAEQCEEIRQIIQEVERRCGTGQWRPGEIRPSAKAPVLMEAAGEIVPELMRWGYRLPSTLVINARAETAAEKPMFRDSVAARRCLIPATGFFEWDAAKRKYLFTLPGKETLNMGGLYDRGAGENCYCILSTAANSSMRPIHDRMPLLIPRDKAEAWITDPKAARDLLTHVPTELIRSSAEDQISLW